jgi:hypothetical protein
MVVTALEAKMTGSGWSDHDHSRLAIDEDDPYGNNPYSVPMPPDTTGDPKWEKQ